ncbi:MAG: hypothetical protein ACLUVG_06930 [Phocaeicola vulgatus]
MAEGSKSASIPFSIAEQSRHITFRMVSNAKISEGTDTDPLSG